MQQGRARLTAADDGAARAATWRPHTEKRIASILHDQPPPGLTDAPDTAVQRRRVSPPSTLQLHRHSFDS